MSTNRPLSVAVVCFPSFGGSGVVASELADGLAERGHRIHLLATARPGRSGEPSKRVRFIEVNAPRYPVFDHGPTTLALASALIELARSERIDVIHAHYALPHAVSGYLARQLLGGAAPKLVTSLHGTDVTGVGCDPSYRAVTCATVAGSDAVTVPSEFLREQAYAKLGLPRSIDLQVMPNFVDTERFAPPATRDRTVLARLFEDSSSADGPVLFHVSNFRAVKRVTDLIETLARVRRSLPARLVLVGDGSDRELAEQCARSHELGDSVRFLGNRSDFVQWLRHADGFLLTSESESFGVAALEALSAGVPVFGYRVGGVPEVVGPDAGRLVDPLDVDALARVVVDALGDRTALTKMSKAARQRAVTQFRRAPALERYEDLFRRTLEAKR